MMRTLGIFIRAIGAICGALLQWWRAALSGQNLVRRVFWTALLGLALGWLGVRFVPLPMALFQPMPESVEITDRHGATLREKRVEERFARAVSLEEVPANLVQAMLAAEDKRFFTHRGVDVAALARACWENLRRRRVTSGASTITQQLVKIADPRPRTLATKLLEAARALRLEQLWTKEQILAAYLNRLDFGNLNIGCAAAAQFYLGKPLADLSDAEAAFLAGLPKNPQRLNPHRAFATARARQATVLRRMRATGVLSAAQLARALGEPLSLRPPARLFRAPHFVDLLLPTLDPDSRQTVTTTLDLDLNRFVERAVREQLTKLARQQVRDAAAVVLDNASGEVLALVGSGDYFAPGSGQVNGAMARRSAGSTFKPFTYLLALEHGATPATVVADVPALFTTSTGQYRPENYSHRCSGPVRSRLALANSLNIPAVKVLAAIGGAGPLQQRLRAWGLTTLDRPAEQYGLGLTIGNAETRLLELTNAYATLARLGEWRPWRLVGENAQRSTLNVERSTTAETRGAAWLIADMLSDNAARTMSFGMHSALRFDFPVACKTGTSTDFRDNWAMGYTPEFTVGVWVGNFDGSPMREVSGVTGAAPILHAVVEELHGRFGTTWFATPPEIVEREVHPITGKLLAAPRADSVREKFLRDHLPPLESPADYDASGGVRLSPEYLAWSESAQNRLAAQATVAPETGGPLVVSPVAGTVFFVDPDLPSSRQVPLLTRGKGRPAWESATLQIRETEGGSFAIAVEGEHRLSATDPATGQRGETWIRVKSL